MCVCVCACVCMCVSLSLCVVDRVAAASRQVVLYVCVCVGVYMCVCIYMCVCYDRVGTASRTGGQQFNTEFRVFGWCVVCCVLCVVCCVLCVAVV